VAGSDRKEIIYAIGLGYDDKTGAEDKMALIIGARYYLIKYGASRRGDGNGGEDEEIL
jgi:hypothetical protein